MEKHAKDLVPGDEVVSITPDLEFEVIGKVVSVKHSTAVLAHAVEDEDLDEPSREVPVATILLHDEKNDERHIWRTNADRRVEILGEADDG